MSDTATIVIAVIGSQIASTGLVLTVLNQRLKDFREVMEEKFKIVDEKFKTFDAKFETLRVEIRADIESLRVEVRELDKQITRRIISGR